jgi:hypothetical protein
MADINVERLAAIQEEYKLARESIAAVRSIAEIAIRAIDDHSKSPAVAEEMMNAS